MITQKNNIRLKPCNQWIAMVKQKTGGTSFYFCVYDYKGNALFESDEYKDAASCEQGVWDLRNEIIDKDAAISLNNRNYTDKIFRETDLLGRINRARLLRSSRVKFKPKNRAVSKNKNAKIEIDSFKIDAKQSGLEVKGKKELKINKTRLGLLLKDKGSQITLDRFRTVFRESGQVVFCSVEEKKPNYVYFPVTPKVIDYMYSLDGRGKIVMDDVVFQDTSNPTSFKQWQDNQNLFWDNTKIREFFNDVIVGEKNEK